MLYADDTQLYLSLDKASSDLYASMLEACIRDIRTWKRRNKLNLNDTNTEIIHFSSKVGPACPFAGLEIGADVISPSPVVKDLGVHMDSLLSMLRQVSAIASASSMALRNIGRIRKYLDLRTTEKLMHSSQVVWIIAIAYCMAFLSTT